MGSRKASLVAPLHEQLRMEHAKQSLANRPKYLPIVHKKRIAWVFHDKEEHGGTGMEYVFTVPDPRKRKPWEDLKGDSPKYELLGKLVRVNMRNHRGMDYHEPVMSPVGQEMHQKVMTRLIEHLKRTGWKPGEY